MRCKGYFKLLNNFMRAQRLLVPLTLISTDTRVSSEVNKCSAVAEIGDHLATIDMGRKLGAVPPYWRGSWVPI